jgi:hypothetical protein
MPVGLAMIPGGSAASDHGSLRKLGSIGVLLSSG